MRASPTDILARKSARRTKVRGQVGELNRPRAPRQADCRRADCRGARRLPRAPDTPTSEVGEEVLVGVGVRVGLVEFKLTTRIKNGGIFNNDSTKSTWRSYGQEYNDASF